MRSRVGLVLVVLAAIVVPVAAIPSVLGWRLQSALRHDLAAQDVRVILQGELGAVTGRFTRMMLEVRGTRLNRLPVQELRAEFTDIEIDSQRVLRRGELAIRRIGSGRATLVVSEEGLQHYVAETTGSPGVRVRLADGMVMVGGKITVLEVPVDVTMGGRLMIQDGRRVVLHLETLAVSGLVLPPDVANAMMASINPLLTVDELPIPVRLREVQVDDGRLTVIAEPPS